jgi:hypothetical protein
LALKKSSQSVASFEKLTLLSLPSKVRGHGKISEIDCDAAFCNDRHLRRDVGGSYGDPRRNKVRQAVSEGTAIGAITN